MRQGRNRDGGGGAAARGSKRGAIHRGRSCCCGPLRAAPSAGIGDSDDFRASRLVEAGVEGAVEDGAAGIAWVFEAGVAGVLKLGYQELWKPD